MRGDRGVRRRLQRQSFNRLRARSWTANYIAVEGLTRQIGDFPAADLKRGRARTWTVREGENAGKVPYFGQFRVVRLPGVGYTE